MFNKKKPVPKPQPQKLALKADDSPNYEELFACNVGVIRRFTGDHEFLSNFYECEIDDNEGNVFKNAEAMFQSYKTTDPEERKKFAEMNAKQAKAYGRKIELRSDWEDIKNDAMFYTLYQKFEQNPDLRRALLETGNSVLIEGNTWGDKTWGMVPAKIPVGDNTKWGLFGENRLGALLMKIRFVLFERDMPIRKHETRDWEADDPDERPVRRYRRYRNMNMSIGQTLEDIIGYRPFNEYLTLKYRMQVITDANGTVRHGLSKAVKKEVGIIEATLDGKILK